MKVSFEGTLDEIKSEMESFLGDREGSVPSENTTSLDDGVDSTGCLWDARVHASSKAKTADGKWKKRRGCDEELYNKLTTPPEQRTASELVVEAPPAPAPETPSAVPPPPAPAPAPAPEPAPATLTDIIQHVARCRDELKIPELELKLNAKAVECGLTQFSDLFNPATDQKVINLFYAKITGEIK